MHLLDFQGYTFIQISHILLFRFSRLSGSQWSSALPVVCVLLILVVLISIAAVWTQFSAEHFFSAGELDSSCTGSNITDQVHFLSGEQFLNLLPYGYLSLSKWSFCFYPYFFSESNMKVNTLTLKCKYVDIITFALKVI